MPSTAGELSNDAGDFPKVAGYDSSTSSDVTSTVIGNSAPTSSKRDAEVKWKGALLLDAKMGEKGISLSKQDMRKAEACLAKYHFYYFPR
ncbi:hypothetical protein IVG45_13195 [Methylomonas sp. LL1]|uniref:hypothetical protein n=1 Tax=Methylomonas sp. LL1 TaxID=2785785 RepID=UPI0018C3BD40|nr:hypothetical protein [Methylomonas sp. LL1]QPK61820.1 hypothetical protein IVG45_13195 [Methylomonas sp. LL1]